jgi:hypothetical protein
MAVPAAYPFVDVRIDTTGLTPVRERAPGVIAVVGEATGCKVATNTPTVVSSPAEVDKAFAGTNGARTKLASSLQLALLQDPQPSKVYGVRIEGDNFGAGLAALEGADDVTFVSLANESRVKATNTEASDNKIKRSAESSKGALELLKDHVERLSAAGQKCLGVAMVDPTTARAPSYVSDVLGSVSSLKSDFSRMVLVAARGAGGDAATAAMAAMAAYPPPTSIVLKPVRGLSIPQASQYGPSEIKGLSEGYVNPIIAPALIPGATLHFADGRCFTNDDSLLFVDTVRTLDDIDARLKAGLIGMVGDARVTREGLLQITARIDGILDPLQRDAVITDYAVSIPVLDALTVPEAARTAADEELVRQSRQDRAVVISVSITYGPAVHRLHVTLVPKF